MVPQQKVRKGGSHPDVGGQQIDDPSPRIEGESLLRK